MSQLAEFATQYGFEYISDIDSSYGAINGYYVLISKLASKHSYVIRFNLATEEKETVADFLQLLSHQHAIIAQTGFNDHKLAISVELSTLEAIVKLKAVIDELTLYLWNQEYPQSCAMSHRTEDLGVYRVINRIDVFNEDVFERYDIQMKEEHAGKNTSVAAGILGAFLGAMIGGVLWVVISQFNIIAGIVGFVIVYLAVKGYEFLGGRIDKKGIAAVVFISLLTVVLAEYIAYVIVVYQELSLYYVATVWDSVVLVFEFLKAGGEILNGFLINVGMGLLFTVMASFHFLRTSMAQAATQYRSEKLMSGF